MRGFTKNRCLIPFILFILVLAYAFWITSKSDIGICDDDNAQELVLLPSKFRRRVKAKPHVFTITVLTMNRAKSLQRLLVSLENSDYLGDAVRLVIKVDHHKNNGRAIEVAKSTPFTHGPKEIVESGVNLGLRRSWLEAWSPDTPNSYGIILEDDVEVSPLWYNWATEAWAAYGDRPEIGGLSLQRQTYKILQPVSSSWNVFPEARPFLYKLLGTIGFLPNPKVWPSFIKWTQSIDLDRFDPTTYGQLPLLETSKWFRSLEPRSWWEAWYIYYCEKNNLYTLYSHPFGGKALASHWRERGEHFWGFQGKDFDLTSNLTFFFPKTLPKYGWAGIRENPAWMSQSIVGLEGTLLRAADSSNSVILTMATDTSDLISNFKKYSPNSVVFTPVQLDLGDDISFQVRTNIIPRVSGSWGKSNFFRVVAAKPRLILRALLHGHNVTWADRDAVIKRPLRFPKNECDIFASIENGAMCWGSSDWSCTGFLHFRNTPETLQFVSEWAGMMSCNSKEYDDQCEFQRLVTRGTTAKVCHLDKVQYANGHMWVPSSCRRGKCMTPEMIREAVVVHANYIVGNDAKVSALKSIGLWKA
jgi:hypothetical protein